MSDLFRRYGHVRHVDVRRGFGYVEYEADGDAAAAIAALNGSIFRGGTRLRVELSKPKPVREEGFASAYDGACPGLDASCWVGLLQP